MGISTANYSFMKPTIGGDKDQWADDYPTADTSGASPGLVGNWRKSDDVIQGLLNRLVTLEGGLPPGTYFDEGSDYVIVGEVMRCWGTVVSQSYDVTFIFPKRFKTFPSIITTCHVPDNFQSSYIADVAPDVGSDGYLQAETHVLQNGGNSNYSGMRVDWFAMGLWDGVS